MSTRKNSHRLILLTLLLLPILPASAQISHGGEPLPLNAGVYTRSVLPRQIPFVEMPSFDVREARLRSEAEEIKTKSLEFAHKFHVFLRPDNSGMTFTTFDGMKVWRVGIRSRNAFSLNLLFSKFRLPEGARLFVYNADQSEILGSYTHENNSDLNLLPVQPVIGDELIVEYQEPTDAAFEAEIEVGEVNHDFRGLFRATEPRDPEYGCHPNVICYPEDIEVGSGVVALIINGVSYCTGVLVNNTSQDGTPYLLTATHCLNQNYYSGFLRNRRYDLMAGSIVAFFNYNAPLCEEINSSGGPNPNNIRGITQMTLASADSVLINEGHDISLLKFKQMPPPEYQPYLLGWNSANSFAAPFHGIHHPYGGVKKVAVENDRLGSFTTFSFVNEWSESIQLESGAHLTVDEWDVGATEGGSSGSPLLDRHKRVVGTLTGGRSQCPSPKGPDVYASLYKAWNVEGHDNPNALKNYLDPAGLNWQQTGGLNPYADHPYTKVSNYMTDDRVERTTVRSVPLFATNNLLGYTEFAEVFSTQIPVKLQGVFIASSITENVGQLNIRIRVYNSNKGRPGSLLHEEPFSYSYRYYQTGDFHDSPRNMRKNVENYVRFSIPVEVTDSFFIAYTDNARLSDGFAALNVLPRQIGSEIASTAWIKSAKGWFPSSEGLDEPISTSLLIAPYVIGTGLTKPIPTPEIPEIKAFYNKENNSIHIRSNRDLISWEVFYVSGQKVFEGKAESSVKLALFPVDHLPKGIYIVKATAIDVSRNIKVLVR